jgi:hypothetical protein
VVRSEETPGSIPPPTPAAGSSDPGGVTHTAAAEDTHRTVRRLQLALVVVAIVAVALFAYLIGVNNGGNAQDGGASSPNGSNGQPSAASPEPASDPCVADVNEVYRSLRALHSRTVVGVNIGEYRQLVGDAQVSLDAVEATPGPCESALQHFDTAVGMHAATAVSWDLCIEEYPDCFVDDTGLAKKSELGGARLFRLYKRWNEAEREVEAGKAALPASTP